MTPPRRGSAKADRISSPPRHPGGAGIMNGLRLNWVGAGHMTFRDCYCSNYTATCHGRTVEMASFVNRKSDGQPGDVSEVSFGIRVPGREEPILFESERELIYHVIGLTTRGYLEHEVERLRRLLDNRHIDHEAPL